FRLFAYLPATGAQAGLARFADGGDDFTTGVAVSHDGSRVFVTGSGGAGDFLTVAFGRSARKPLWFARYDGGHGTDNASSVAVSPDGTRVYVTGESEQAGIACFGDVRSAASATVRYDAATGVQGWV